MKESFAHMRGWARELTSVARRYPEKFRKKYAPEGQQDRVQKLIVEKSIEGFVGGRADIKILGRGWHGTAALVGEKVYRVHDAYPPSLGFGYDQTESGAQELQEDIDQMRKQGKMHNLPHLVPEVHVQLVRGEVANANRRGERQPFQRIVAEEQFFHIISPKEISHVSREVKQQLLEELDRFVLYAGNVEHTGMIVDLFGKDNLSIAQVANEYHLVLIDPEPGKKNRVQALTKVLLDVMFAVRVSQMRRRLTQPNVLLN